MGIIKTIMILIYIGLCIAITVLALLQSKQTSGASGTIIGGEGAETDNFYEKNKSRTKEGKMMRWTIILVAIFAVFAIGLEIFLQIVK